MARKTVTLNSIAEACGISSVTVSKALSGKDGVSDELREKIKNTAREMGYVFPVRPSKSEINGNIGIIIPEKFVNPIGTFYWTLYNKIVQRLKQDNISCIQENINEQEEASLTPPNILTNDKIVGLISLGQLDPEYIKLLMKLTGNIILLDYYLPDINIDAVISNGISGGYRITKHLIENGHKDIGFVGTRLATSSIFDRFVGFSKAMLENGLTVREECIINDRNNDNMFFGDFGEIILPEKMPTAFVCNCDEIAFIIIRKLKNLGYSVPDDISVVGYDNFLISDIAEPQITTISVDAAELADASVSLLMDRINNPLKKSEIRSINGELEIKNSVRRI